MPKDRSTAPVPKKPKKQRVKEPRAKHHQSNKQHVTVNVHVESKGGRRSGSKASSGKPPQPPPQQQMRAPAPTVVHVQQSAPLPPVPPAAPYVAIPSSRPSFIENVVAGDTQKTVDRSLNSTHSSYSGIPSLMGSYASAGDNIGGTIHSFDPYEDDAVSELSFGTAPVEREPDEVKPQGMFDYLATYLPYRTVTTVSQPASVMHAQSAPAPSMMTPIMEEEETSVLQQLQVPAAKPLVVTPVKPAPEPVPEAVDDHATVKTTDTQAAFREIMTGPDAESTLKRLKKAELIEVYKRYFSPGDNDYERYTTNKSGYAGHEKKVILSAILRRINDKI